MPYCSVLYGDPGTTENIAAIPCDIQRHSHIVPLRQADLCRLHPAGVFKTAKLQGQQLSSCDSSCHIGKADLNGLVGCQWPAKQFTVGGIFHHLGKTGNRSADGTPGNTVTCLCQTTQRSFKADNIG